MSDIHNAAGESANPAAESQSAQSGGVNLFAVLALLLVAAVCGWAGYIYVTSDKGFDLRRFTFQGKQEIELVPVTGQLLYNGEPMNNGVLMLSPVDESSGMKNAIGPLSEGGKFELLTDVDGMQKGAMVGEYKVVLNVILPLRPGQLAPDRALPNKYYSADTTPVRITVSADADKNHIVIRETGDPVAAGGGGRKKQPGGRFNPEEIIKRILSRDANGDGKISRDEASDRLKPRFDQMDANKDGLLDKQELEAGLRAGRRGKRKPRPKGDPKTAD